MTVIKSHSEAGRISATALAELNATSKVTAAVFVFIPMITLYVSRWRIAEEPESASSSGTKTMP
ncbi:hypothetical protein [Cronobacter dublinensis]|uniref:hypothetical protein n=1 Tax=Cronobacter dublinensis TaxID=413497 RepID=UPI00300E2E45